MIRICVSSTSELKLQAIREVVGCYFIDRQVEIISISTSDAEIPEQPVNSGEKCVRLRNEYMKRKIKEQNIEYDFLISIENEIITDKNKTGSYLHTIETGEEYVADVCNVLIEDKYGNIYIDSSNDMSYVNKKYYQLAVERSDPNYKYKKDGLSITVGSIIHEENPDIPANNWMMHVNDTSVHNTDRENIIFQLVRSLFITINERQVVNISKSGSQHLKKLKSAIIKVADFPKEGVLFQDLSDILADRKLLHCLCNQLKNLCEVHIMTSYVQKKLKNGKKLKIMGLDARGFIYGTILATKLDCGFIMARKAGKLPGETIKQEYGTEYSKACIEIMPHLINDDDLIIIVDDLVATGGSLKAAVDLARKRNAHVIACITVLQVDELLDQAKEKLEGIPLHVLIK